MKCTGGEQCRYIVSSLAAFIVVGRPIVSEAIDELEELATSSSAFRRCDQSDPLIKEDHASLITLDI